MTSSNGYSVATSATDRLAPSPSTEAIRAYPDMRSSMRANRVFPTGDNHRGSREAAQ